MPPRCHCRLMQSGSTAGQLCCGTPPNLNPTYAPEICRKQAVSTPGSSSVSTSLVPQPFMCACMKGGLERFTRLLQSYHVKKCTSKSDFKYQVTAKYDYNIMYSNVRTCIIRSYLALSWLHMKLNKENIQHL